jgi:TRAP-type mannitol/chloroaromatic compound transport system permease large subunit
MGLLSVPTMLHRKYNKALTTGTVAASGTLGQIIPPSIVLVLLGDQLSIAFQNAQYSMGNYAPDTVSVNDLFAGALLPGLMLVGMYLVYQFVFAILRPDQAPAIPADELIGGDRKAFYKQLAGTLFAPLILIVAVLGSILGGLASPTEAASVGAVGAIMLAGYKINPKGAKWIFIGALSLFALFIITMFFDLRVQRDVIPASDMAAIVVAAVFSLGLVAGILSGLWSTLKERDEDGTPVLASVGRSTVQISSMVFVILVGAAMFSLVFRGFEGDVYIEEFLKNLPGGTIGAMLLVMGVMFIMGFFLDFLEIIFIVVPIVAPILLTMEVADGVTMSPVWLGVMMGINLQTSFLTPPFGFALFYLRGVAPRQVRTMDIYRGVAPYVVIQVLALVLLWFWPQIATWLPAAIYD